MKRDTAVVCFLTVSEFLFVFSAYCMIQNFLVSKFWYINLSLFETMLQPTPMTELAFSLIAAQNRIVTQSR